VNDRIDAALEKFDAWGVEDEDEFTIPSPVRDAGGYDSAAVYKHSTNEHDHSAYINKTRVPPMVLNYIGQIIQSGRTEYRTAGDFIRDAIIHRLQWWHVNGFPQIDTTLDRVQGELALARMRREQWRELIEVLRGEMSTLGPEHREAMIDVYEHVAALRKRDVPEVLRGDMDRLWGDVVARMRAGGMGAYVDVKDAE